MVSVNIFISKWSWFGWSARHNFREGFMLTQSQALVHYQDPRVCRLWYSYDSSTYYYYYFFFWENSSTYYWCQSVDSDYCKFWTFQYQCHGPKEQEDFVASALKTGNTTSKQTLCLRIFIIYDAFNKVIMKPSCSPIFVFVLRGFRCLILSVINTIVFVLIG